MSAKYRWDEFVLDLDAFRLERDGVPQALEPKAFDLLTLLVRQRGHLFTKQEIFDALWPETAVTDHALTRVVAQLRRVLGDDARQTRYIETVPTRGYRWIAPVVAVEAPDAHVTPADVAPVVRAKGAWRRLAPVAASFGLIVLLAAWLWSGGIDSAPASPPPRAAWPVQVTTSPGVDLHPAFSPHGDALAFVSDRSGSFEIYVRALAAGAAEVSLTQNGAQNVQPAWSPDGQMIAFHSLARGGIWVVPSRGGTPRQVAAEGSAPAWSPDGRQIAFQSDELSDLTPGAFGALSGSTIRVVDPDGSNPRQLTRPDEPLGGHGAPAWSNDGRYLAFSVSDGGPNNGIWLLTLDTRRTALVARGRSFYEVVFAPDDSALFAAGGDPFISRLPFDARAGRAAGEREVMPVAGVASVRGITISSRRGQLAFAGLTLTSHIWRQDLRADGRARGAARAVTTDASRRDSLPVVSHDGSQIAYISRRGGEPSNLWIISAEGGTALQVTADDYADLQPHWFPDGRRLAFVSSRQNSARLYSIDVTTRREQLILDMSRAGPHAGLAPGGKFGEFSLSPSMTRAAFSIVKGPLAHRQLHVTGLDSFAPRALTDGGEWIGFPAWSPDERSLAVEIKAGSSTHAGIADAQGGTVRRLTHERGHTWVRGWSPDANRISAAAFRGGRWDLRWIDATTGQQAPIVGPAVPRVYMRYPAVSPRGDYVVFERGELRGNIWTLPVTH